MARTQMLLEDWLDDLCVRFIINLPHEDLSSVARICFQVEEAQWFYEDFIRPLDPTLPSMSLRTFCLRIFQHCPLLASFSVENHTEAFEEFLQYKTRVPVRGAIMLNQAMDSVVLVKGWKKGASWSFPRGKINKDEDDLDCAVREVYEETGLDIRAAGLVPEKKPKSIEISMREQQLRLYVFRDIPMDTDFQPRTRKEISKIQWYRLSELPTFSKKGDKSAQHNDDGAGNQNRKFYMVAPFLVPLKKWIASQRKMDQKRAASANQTNLAPQYSAADEAFSIDDETWATDQRGAPDGLSSAETLSGATQELQRLLKMQRHMEASLQPQHQNKGSALLSILQAGNNSRPQDVTKLPQTPVDLSGAEPPPPPRNPHHHTNQHHPVSRDTHAQEPPPSFKLGSNQKTVTLNVMSKQDYNPPKPPPHAAGMGQQQHPVRRDRSLVNTQPLPSQILQDVLSRSASHGSPASHQTSRVQMQSGQTGGPVHSPLPPTVHVGQGSRTAQLDGHSMALMKVMKRDVTPTVPYTEASSHNKSQASVPKHQPAATMPPYGSVSLPRQLPHLTDSSPRHASSSALPRIGASLSTDDHRSALLGIFKRTELDAGPPKQQVQDDRNLAGHATSPGLLSTQPRLSQNGLSEHGAQGNRMLYVHGPGQTGITKQKPLQPTMVLQRGQSLDDDNSRARLPLQGLPERLSGAQDAKAVQSSGAVSRRAGGSDEKKMQLLSLFGRQQNATLGSGKGEGQSGSVASTSPLREREPQTPMSPADQSFVLEYLQSVTNNAGR
ncbi:hypothetical protein XA68_16234 [Ophiocordyceps unilateralis]|uniref:Nudix hydrolase domain-containing protein n=1 Tax=Ophiocordyceps unilateralis TaxID=268505 RepID=A0A2A9PLW9_OPHUN|nr:hypothetical protein XA68_16234 [Ophiocordyceps unilateralis]